MIKLVILFSFLFFFFKVDGQETAHTFLPISNAKVRLIEHRYYSLAYSEIHKQASWVCYRLTLEFIKGDAKRKNNFRADPRIESNASELADYKGSGFDRGHLCPAGSMKINQLAMDDSFYLTNMSPQLPSFNRGAWKTLEEQVRKWLVQEDTLYVVTGPILNDSIGVVGFNKITLPAYYYKVIYDPTGVQKMTAFILPHKKIKEDISLYAVSVDEVEKRTGINFFSQLDDDLENKLEAEIILWKRD
jgi:endonuclease G